MATQPVTLHLSEEILNRARQIAQALQRPLEDVLAETLAAILPDVTDTPVSMQAELVRMTWLSDKELWQIARSQMSDEDQTRLAYLSERRAEIPLMPDEEQALVQLG